MIDSVVIDKRKLGKKIGCIAGLDNDNGQFKNTVIGYINGDIPIFIKTNMNQREFNKYCNGELSEEELLKFT